MLTNKHPIKLEDEDLIEYYNQYADNVTNGLNYNVTEFSINKKNNNFDKSDFEMFGKEAKPIVALNCGVGDDVGIPDESWHNIADITEARYNNNADENKRPDNVMLWIMGLWTNKIITEVNKQVNEGCEEIFDPILLALGINCRQANWEVKAIDNLSNKGMDICNMAYNKKNQYREISDSKKFNMEIKKEATKKGDKGRFFFCGVSSDNVISDGIYNKFATRLLNKCIAGYKTKYNPEELNSLIEDILQGDENPNFINVDGSRFETTQSFELRKIGVERVVERLIDLLGNDEEGMVGKYEFCTIKNIKTCFAIKPFDELNPDIRDHDINLDCDLHIRWTKMGDNETKVLQLTRNSKIIILNGVQTSYKEINKLFTLFEGEDFNVITVEYKDPIEITGHKGILKNNGAGLTLTNSSIIEYEKCWPKTFGSKARKYLRQSSFVCHFQSNGKKRMRMKVKDMTISGDTSTTMMNTYNGLFYNYVVPNLSQLIDVNRERLLQIEKKIALLRKKVVLRAKPRRFEYAKVEDQFNKTKLYNEECIHLNNREEFLEPAGSEFVYDQEHTEIMDYFEETGFIKKLKELQEMPHEQIVEVIQTGDDSLGVCSRLEEFNKVNYSYTYGNKWPSCYQKIKKDPKIESTGDFISRTIVVGKGGKVINFRKIQQVIKKLGLMSGLDIEMIRKMSYVELLKVCETLAGQIITFKNSPIKEQCELHKEVEDIIKIIYNIAVKKCTKPSKKAKIADINSILNAETQHDREYMLVHEKKCPNLEVDDDADLAAVKEMIQRIRKIKKSPNLIIDDNFTSITY